MTLLFSVQALNLKETESCVCWALRHVTCGQFAEVSVTFLVFSKVQLVRCRPETSHLSLAGENLCAKGFSGAGSVSGFSLSELTHLDGLLFQMVKNTYMFLMDEWMSRVWHIPAIRCYSAVIKRRVWHVTTWLNLEDVLLSEISQSQKDKYCMMSLLWGP